MLKATEELLNLTRIYMDELGFDYHTKDEIIDYDKIYDGTMYAITHADSLEDAKEAIKMYRYLTKYSDRIVKAINKYPDYFDSLVHGKNEMLSLVDDEESEGTFYVTNALLDSDKEITLLSTSLEENGCLYHEKFKYSLYGYDSEYFLRYSKLNEEKMVIENKAGIKLCVLSLDNNADIVLKNNCTKYETSIYNGYVVFHEKGKHKISEDDFIAALCWDILDKKSIVGVARLDIFNEDADIELLTLLATSCLLIFKKKMKPSVNPGLVATLSSQVIFRH